MSDRITELCVRGFKSIRELDRFQLRPINVLIGANGAGKSSLINAKIGLPEIREQCPIFNQWIATLESWASKELTP